MNHSAKVRFAGVMLTLVVITAFALTGAFYTRAFSDSARITVESSRSGLVMGPGNKVKMRGVEIGRVDSVERDGDVVLLELDIDRDELDKIPSDVAAEIRASTVFGATSQAIDDGAVIAATSVTTEVNTVFDSLDTLLSSVDVVRLNTTLGVLAQTLDGRGDEIADVAVVADDYLTRLEPLLPQLRRDLVQIAAFSRLSESVSPELLSILRSSTVTAKTIATQEQAVHHLLVDLSLLGGRGAEVLGLNGKALAALLEGVRPTAATLRAYSVELPCLIKGLDRARAAIADAIGGTTSALRGYVSARSKMSKYTFPHDLPAESFGGRPVCHSLPVVPMSQVPVPEVGEPE